MGFRFEQQVLVEFDFQRRDGPANCSQILTIHVVGDAVSAFGEAAQRDFAVPLRHVEGIIHAAIFANRMSLRPVKTDVIQPA